MEVSEQFRLKKIKVTFCHLKTFLLCEYSHARSRRENVVEVLNLLNQHSKFIHIENQNFSVSLRIQYEQVQD